MGSLPLSPFLSLPSSLSLPLSPFLSYPFSLTLSLSPFLSHPFSLTLSLSPFLSYLLSLSSSLLHFLPFSFLSYFECVKFQICQLFSLLFGHFHQGFSPSSVLIPLLPLPPLRSLYLPLSL